jgi:TonB family protein
VKTLLTAACLTVVVASIGRIDGQSPYSRDSPFNIDGFGNRPTRTKTVAPSYPSDASAGTVILKVKIDPEGRVNAVTVVRGVAGATAAASAAVLQWEYTPTTLNGEAIWIVMSIGVPSPWRDDAADALPA